MANKKFWDFASNYQRTPYTRVVPDKRAEYEARGYGKTHNDPRDRSLTYEMVSGPTYKVVSGESYQKRDPNSNQWHSITRSEYEAARLKLLPY